MWISVFLIVLAANFADATLAIEGRTNGSTFYAIDGRVENLTCSHSGIEQPLPTLTWDCYNGTVRDISNDTVARAEVTWTANRENETRCTCLSFHPFNGSRQVYVDVRVRYPPSVPRFSLDSVPVSGTVYVIDRSHVLIVCISTGNPSPTYTWNPSGNNGLPYQLILYPVQTNDNGKYTCTVTNTMQPSNGQPLNSTKQATISVETLVPPSTPLIHLGNSSGPVVPWQAYFFRGDNFNLYCASTGNPDPVYEWTSNGDVISNISIANVTDIRNHVYIYCKASNILIPTTGSGTNRSSSSYIIVNVLYPPTVNSWSNLNAVENRTIIRTCYASGSPSVTYQWTRVSNNETVGNQTMTLTNVTKQHAGTYKCTASNTMNSTFDGVRQGTDSKTFELTVQYAATIVNFTFNAVSDNNPHTVDEFSHITMACNVDSVPDARISIYRDDINVAREYSGTLASYIVNNATCLDAGLYKCAASNRYNSGGGHTTSRQLLVLCPPRALNIANNRTYPSALGQSITLSLTFVAYPAPFSYNWQKLRAQDTWMDLTSGVKSDARQSNITLQNIQPEDFGQYRVKVINPQGILDHQFFLVAQDRPQSPIELSILAETVTSNSAVVTWIGGFNGGLEQVYYVEYKASSETAWDVTTVADSTMTSLNATLVKLLPATEYTVRVYSRNNIGSSGKSQTIIFTTKALPDPPASSPVGAIVGGIFGALIVAAIVIVLVITQRRYQWTNGNTEMGDFETKAGYENLPGSKTKAIDYENLRKTAGGMKEVDTGKSDYEPLRHTNSPKKLYDSLKKNTGEGGKDGNNRTDYENLKKVNRGNKPKIAAKPKKPPVYENLRKK